MNAERAIELDPEFADAHKLFMSLQQAQGSAARTNNGGHRQEILSPDAQQYFDQANVSLQQGKMDEAISYFENVLQQQPDLAVGWFMLGRTRAQQAQYAEVERCCREAIRLDSEFVQAHMLLASFFLMQGRSADACKHSDKALGLSPGDVNAIALAANIAKHMGDPEKSYELLSPLLEKGVVHINIALAFVMIRLTAPSMTNRWRDGKTMKNI